MLLAATAVSVRAQNASPAKGAPVVLHANVMSIRDIRSTGNPGSGCLIELGIFGDALEIAQGVLRARPTRAVDDLGHDLLRYPGTGFSFAEAMPIYPVIGYLRRNVVDIRLPSPSRKASAIKVLEVALDLFEPTESNGGMITITDASEHPGTPVANAALRNLRIELTCLTHSQADELRLNTMNSAEERRLSAVAREVERRRAMREAAEREGPLASASENHDAGVMPPSSAAFTVSPRLPQTASEASHRSNTYIQIKDPNQKVIGFDCRDTAGTSLDPRPIHVFSHTSVRTYAVRRPLPEHTRFVVFVDVPPAEKPATLRLENILLP